MKYYSYPGLSIQDRRRWFHKINRERKITFNRRLNRWLRAIFQATGVTHDQLKKRSRKRTMVYLRAIVAYNLYDPSVTSLLKIGEAIGRRDHTTVRHLIRKVYPNMKETGNAEFIRLEESIRTYL